MQHVIHTAQGTSSHPLSLFLSSLCRPSQALTINRSVNRIFLKALEQKPNISCLEHADNSVLLPHMWCYNSQHVSAVAEAFNVINKYKCLCLFGCMQAIEKHASLTSIATCHGSGSLCTKTCEIDQCNSWRVASNLCCDLYVLSRSWLWRRIASHTAT